jgi:unsaturated rhamnogalacturonyl hydrolase
MDARGIGFWRVTAAIWRCGSVAVLLGLSLPAAWAQSFAQSEKIADAAMRRWPASEISEGLNNGPGQPGLGLLLEALNEEWLGTANPAYFNYGRAIADRLIDQAGAPEKVASESAALGRELLLLYRVTQQERYWKPASALRQRLLTGQRGGSRDAQAEDLFEIEPFLAEYASVVNVIGDLSGITQQFTRPAPPAREPEAARRETAWRLAALVDTLPFYPRNDPDRAALLVMLRRLAERAQADERRQRLAAEDFTPSLVAYAFAKAARLGYLPESYAQAAKLAHRQAMTGLGEISSSAGGPDRAGALLLAAREMEIAPLTRLGRGRVALMDAWFNSQKRKNAAGDEESFHYKWGDYSNSGFSMVGHLLKSYGIDTETLDAAPTGENLKSAQFYLIVSPDIPAKNPHPHYATAHDAEQVAAWVRQGGILLLMENDPDNADIDHMDLIADVFGLHFNKVLSHHVEGDNFPMGRIEVAGGGELFTQPHTIYMKDTCTLRLSGQARPLLVDKGDVMMASAKYGKGTVFAVVDPWLYNEYTDGRKLPPEYDNLAAARELLEWLTRQMPGR